MNYIEYKPPAGWHPSIIMGVEMLGNSSTISGSPIMRCEICKEVLADFTYLCPWEECRTIISMMEPDENRLKSIAVPPTDRNGRIYRPIKKVW